MKPAPALAFRRAAKGEIPVDIKKQLLDMVYSANAPSAFLAVEKLVRLMLEDCARREGKQVGEGREDKRPLPRREFCDLILPQGIGALEGRVAVEIKVLRHSRSYYDVMQRTIGRLALSNVEFNAILLIIVDDLPEVSRRRMEELASGLPQKFVIWDVNDLAGIFEKNEPLFVQSCDNIRRALMRDTVNSGIGRPANSYVDNRRRAIHKLHAQYENDNLVLFLGAGASREANVATWDALISELFVALVDQQLAQHSIQIGEADKEAILQEVMNQNGSSPLLQTRFLRSGFEGDFEDLVRRILYKNAGEQSPLLEEIGQLCIPNRGKLGIRAIVTYNFDDLIEKNLRRLRVLYRSIYAEGMSASRSELAIYHVHGFLPERKEGYEDLAKSLLVFSEEGYHKLTLEPYNWANITQLNFMMQNTCLFIGLSMTDPNMRRLLEIAAQKASDEREICRHYAIMRRFSVERSSSSEAIENFERVNESLQESFFGEMGINVIWIDSFDEIPGILRQIKRTPNAL